MYACPGHVAASAWIAWACGRTACIWTRPLIGGHTGEIARRLTTGLVLACDRDAESLRSRERITADCSERIRFHQASFTRLGEVLEAEK